MRGREVGKDGGRKRGRAEGEREEVIILCSSFI